MLLFAKPYLCNGYVGCWSQKTQSLIAAFFVMFLSFTFLSVQQVQAAPGDKKPSEVRVIVDISGSMKHTDPNNLRKSAVNMLVEMLPENSRAGVYTFGKYVNPLVPMAKVDAAWRAKTKASIDKINSVGLMTNLTDALSRAAWQLNDNGDYRQSVILLTDGKVDMALPSNKDRDAINLKYRNKLLNQVLDKYRKNGAKIHTLGLSDGVDKDLLEQIALETNGLYSQAKTSDELLKAFLRLFDQAVPSEQVPMEDNTFVIDSSVKEFTALIFRKTSKPSQLLAPNGDTYSAQNANNFEQVRWYQDLAFDLITITKPEAGTWLAEADLDDNNRVTILSDMALNVSGFPTTIFAGDKIDLAIALQNAGQTIVKPELLRLTDITVKVVAADGRSGLKTLSNPETVPADGIYHEIFTRLQDQGQYEIEVTAESKTFSRKQTIFSNLIQPVEVVENGSEQEYEILVKALSDNLDVERSRVIAKVQAPGESAIIQSIEFKPELNAWQLIINQERGIGRYQVELNVRGVTQSGRTFKVKPETIIFDLPYNADDSQRAISDQLNDELSMIEPVNPEAVLEETVSEEVIEEPVEEPVVEEPIAEEQTPESIVPDLAAKMAEQEEAEIDEFEELSESEGLDEALDDEELAEDEGGEDEGMPWWLYLILAIVNLAVVAGGVWYFFLNKKGAANNADHESDLPPLLDEDALDDPELNEEPGDFDDGASDDEETIDGSDFDDDLSLGDEPLLDEEDGEENEAPPSMVATDQQEPEDVDDAFAIDQEEEDFPAIEETSDDALTDDVVADAIADTGSGSEEGDSEDDSEDDWGEFDSDLDSELEDAIDEKTAGDDSAGDDSAGDDSAGDAGGEGEEKA